MSEHPQLLYNKSNVIVVGAVDNLGNRADFSQGTEDELTVSAPGVAVECAWMGDDPQAIKMRSGTSYGMKYPVLMNALSQLTIANTFQKAAPTVAGVVAVWLSQKQHAPRLLTGPGETARNVKKMIQDLAYPRIAGQPRVIWNGVDPRDYTCASFNKRSGGDKSCAVSSSAAAAAPTPTPSSVPNRPPPPAKPFWNANPAGFKKVLEKDGVASFDYSSTSDSLSDGVTDKIEEWCLGKCTGKRIRSVVPGSHQANLQICHRWLPFCISIQSVAVQRRQIQSIFYLQSVCPSFDCRFEVKQAANHSRQVQSAMV